ncbi:MULTISPECIES: AAA family ATPase [unclassified Polaromonas]|uniref:AAA family ATPase n=1 Tax=unclassified Polaromonas TaxID=2638319 RepID=UPI00197E4636|nr:MULTISPECIES: AAA family ATPase [unclassified Polaromonas]
MLAWLNRYLPVFIALSVLIMVVQLLRQVWPATSALSSWYVATELFLRTWSWYFIAAGLTLVFLSLVCWLHWLDRAPQWIYRVISMDILDRLTNKQQVQDAAALMDQESLVIDAESLGAALKAKVVGQDAVCNDLSMQLRRRLALMQRQKPAGVFLFAGPPGTGKTYLAKVLAAELNRKLLHFDMTQFSAGSFSATQLFGMTKGYVGSDSYGKLTGGLRDHPAAVVLLDEIEKAHPEVLKGFLTAWNDGFVTEASDGKQISTSQAIFILTSNAATDVLTALQKDFAADPDSLRMASVNALKENGFAPEVLNRIDRIFVFAALAGLDVARVCALEMEAMIRGYGLEVAGGGVDPVIIVQLMQRYRRMGSAASSRDVVRALEESIADSLIKARQLGYDLIELRIEDGKIRAKASQKAGLAAKPQDADRE